MLGFLCLAFSSQPSCGQSFTQVLDGWQIENIGGRCSQTEGVLRLWIAEYSYAPSVTIFKEIHPASDFSFSVQVNAQNLLSGAIYVRTGLQQAGSTEGFNFEYGHWGNTQFLLARNKTVNGCWGTDQVALGDPHAWYTMQLNVTQFPFTITTSVLDDDGLCIGTFSTTDIIGTSFEDIKYIGLGVWGYSSDYLFRNIQDSFGDTSPRSSLSISAQCSASTAGSVVDVFGVLSDADGVPVQNKTVVLSYTFMGLDSWIPISSCQTSEQGEYNIQWINSASGTFTLKAAWSGDATHLGASNTTSLSFVPYMNQQDFFFESNSTVTALSFDNATATLNFQVSGASGTTGFVRASIPKSMLTDGADLQVCLDDKPLTYTVTSIGDSWLYVFTYSHSTHQISIHIQAATAAPQSLITLIVLVVIVAILSVAIGVIAYAFAGRGQQKQKPDSPNSLL
jgi:hypothetical protein